MPYRGDDIAELRDRVTQLEIIVGGQEQINKQIFENQRRMEVSGEERARRIEASLDTQTERLEERMEKQEETTESHHSENRKYLLLIGGLILLLGGVVPNKDVLVEVLSKVAMHP